MSQTDKEMAKFIGTWKYGGVTYDGMPYPIGTALDGSESKIVIAKDKWTIHRHGIVVNSTWSIDATTTPKTLIQRVTHPEHGKFVVHSIYRFHPDGRLEICEPDDPGSPKPTRFSADKGDGQFLCKLRRDEKDKPVVDR